jgi:hypothetical protein
MKDKRLRSKAWRRRTGFDNVDPRHARKPEDISDRIDHEIFQRV